MSIIAFKKIETIKGKQEFCKLEIDGKCQFDDYIEELKAAGSYESEINTLFSRMEGVAEDQRMPKNKFRELKGGKGKFKEFEIKTKHLRVYLVKIPNGKLVVYAGYKNSQTADINKFRSIVKNKLQDLL